MKGIDSYIHEGTGGVRQTMAMGFWAWIPTQSSYYCIIGLVVRVSTVSVKQEKIIRQRSKAERGFHSKTRFPTSILVDLVERVLGDGEHPHVRPELLDQRLDHVAAVGVAGHADALGGHLLARVLEVEPHHAVELQLLRGKGNKQTLK